MKNKIIALVVIALITALMTLTACGLDTEHVHEYGEWIAEVPATCTTDGAVGHYHCNTCGKDFDADKKKIEDITVAATGHTFDTVLIYDEIGHWYPAICEHTEERKDYAEHNFVVSEDGSYESCACGYSKFLKLNAPSNLTYGDFLLTFDQVNGASDYVVEFAQEGKETLSFVTAEAALNLKENHVPFGTYTIKVTARCDGMVSETAELSTRIDAYDGDVVLEAEDAALNEKNVSIDEKAHGGAYVMDINDCGQGLYFRYYAYEAGERNVDIVYSTDDVNPFMGVYVNGVKQAVAVFTERTGWFGDSEKSASTTVTLTLAAGWNEITLMKDGTGADTPSYGGFAQIDYIRVKGTGKSYTNDFDMSSETYKLEAESAKWHWANGGERPANWTGEGDKFSHGFGLGNISSAGDGVEFRFKVAETGAYILKLAYSGPNGVTVNTSVSVNGGEEFTHQLSGASGAWNIVTLDQNGIGLELTAGEWYTVDYSALTAQDSNNWWCTDYLLITKVDHLHDFTDQNTDEKYLASEATCTEPAKYYYSCKYCGEVSQNTFEYGEAKGHTFATELTNTDPTGHYYAATCEHTTEKKDFEAHSFVEDEEQNIRVCACGYSEPIIASLEKPANLAISNVNLLTFDEVANAKQYLIEVYADTEMVKSITVTTNSYNLTDQVPAGDYTVKVTAKCGATLSETQTLNVKVLVIDGDVILEAEDATLTQKHISIDEKAHGGAYALGIDDCGQGLYFRYFAYEAGKRNVDIVYSTGSPDSYMGVYVNGVRQTEAIYTENTGWFGDSRKSATATVQMTFVAGWNEFYLLKDSVNGGWAQIDYVCVKGTGKGFDVNTDKSATTYKLEAECAGWHWANGNQRPINWGTGTCSFGYGLGEINQMGDGCKFRFKVTETGTYNIQLAYGYTGDRNVAYKINGGEEQKTTLSGSFGWDNFVPSANAITVQITAGEWFEIDFYALNDGDWFTIDYLLVTKTA